jgi:hypothetical protein
MGVGLLLALGGQQTAADSTKSVEVDLVGSIVQQGVDTGLAEEKVAQATDLYTVLAWNDLGMHCYNRDFRYIAILPPYNTLWAQVIKIGDPPQVITTGITVTYEIIDNSYSVGKSNFWTYDLALYGVDLPPNVGLAGKGLAGEMNVKADHFVAEGIPLTEFRDSDTVTPYPYMLGKVVVWDAVTGAKLAETTPVVPVSTEMHCGDCHYDGGVEGIATGSVERNILRLHDMENANEYLQYDLPVTTPLWLNTPVRCSSCHASNATGLPYVAGIPNLSRAMHERHAEEVPTGRDGCYKCHPGPQTQCQRDVMTVKYGIECPACHGTMSNVANNPNPWLNEPRCDAAGCHPSYTYPAGVLYRNAADHGGIYCEGCHDSPHAIAPSREANDRIKFIALQGYAGALRKCGVCHETVETLVAGPHGLGPLLPKAYLPLTMATWAP